jgi:high-affinity Fe2+/Pb2+ permease
VLAIFGPVSSANNEPSPGFALFLLGLGLYVLIYLWYRYFTAQDDKPTPPLENMIFISLIACGFIGTGIWELIRALRISN